LEIQHKQATQTLLGYAIVAILKPGHKLSSDSLPRFKLPQQVDKLGEKQNNQQNSCSQMSIKLL